ncbi:MAG: O-succinylhomoserine sulfhydrylase [Acidiferrobacterales bacterium]|nr:O-succinylhomoserine sulfhydrylase [Acidiferrobacterales bacterium]
MSEKKSWQDYRPATQEVRAGQVRSSEQEHSEPIYTTSSFVFDSAEQAAARFSYQEVGNVYSRFTNPTVHVFEQRLAALEGGDACVGTASGMAAMLSICMAGLEAGDHIISSRSIFGASYLLLTSILKKFGIETTFVDLTDLKQWQSALRKNTKMVFFETPTNPLTEVGDIAAIAEIAHRFNSDIKVVVDNCFCTPALQRPLQFGADVVMHSATKFIDGQGRCVGGAVVGDAEFVGEKVFAFMRTAGPSMSAFNAWVFAKGLETLSLRVNQACDNAKQVAQWLAEQANVEQVYYPGLESHPQFDLAASQQNKAGAIVSFTVKGAIESAWKLINATQLLSITANLGDTRTTITHPYTTTHARWTDQDKAQAGIDEGLIRLAIGLEDPLDIIEDLQLKVC